MSAQGMAKHKFQRPAKTQRRVVVTGVGAVTPLGNSADASWEKAFAGISGISHLTKFDTKSFDVQFGGEVKDFSADTYIEKKEQKKMDLFVQYAMASSLMAFEQSQLKVSEELAPRMGVLIGVGMGGLPQIEEQYKRFLEKGPGRISPFFIPSVITNLAAGQVSIAVGAQGVNYSVTSACASGAHSIGEATRYIRDGLADVMLAGGSESTVCPLGIGGFAAMKALSTRNENPQEASRPWDQQRDGFILAEGSGMILLEELEHALKRGAPILCEVTGYGASADAYHMTTPAPEGAGGGRAMKLALQDAQLETHNIQYINAHGTSTPVGDALESLAIEKLFGSKGEAPWVSSTKSVMGHALGAAGAIESVFCVLALRDQKVPPTMNLKNPSEDCRLDYVPMEGRSAPLLHVMNNSFGFGGTNASLIFSKFLGD